MPEVIDENISAVNLGNPPSPSKRGMNTKNVVKPPAGTRRVRDGTPGRKVVEREKNQIVVRDEEDDDGISEQRSVASLLCWLTFACIVATSCVVANVYVREHGMPKFSAEDAKKFVQETSFSDLKKMAVVKSTEMQVALGVAATEVAQASEEIYNDVSVEVQNFVHTVKTTDYEKKGRELVDAVKQTDFKGLAMDGVKGVKEFGAAIPVYATTLLNDAKKKGQEIAENAKPFAKGVAEELHKHADESGLLKFFGFDKDVKAEKKEEKKPEPKKEEVKQEKKAEPKKAEPKVEKKPEPKKAQEQQPPTPPQERKVPSPPTAKDQVKKNAKRDNKKDNKKQEL